MAKEKGRQWDGRSRPSSDLYKKRFDEIFNKPKKKKLKNVITEEQWVEQMMKDRK